MNNLTRNGIAYDLVGSPYRYNEIYKNSTITFVFSSELYLTKFKEKQAENRNKINHSLSKRFGFSIDNPVLSDLVLYKSIEKRGFLIYQDGVGFKCQDTIILDGVILTTPS